MEARHGSKAVKCFGDCAPGAFDVRDNRSDIVGKGPKSAQKGAYEKGKGKPWGEGLKGQWGITKARTRVRESAPMEKGIYGVESDHTWYQWGAEGQDNASDWGTVSQGDASDWGPHACAWGEGWPRMEHS